MGDRSAIEWTEATWNPVTGCSKVSPGCAHCYAETLTHRYAATWGVPRLPWTPANAGENVILRPERLDQPLRWKRPRMVFVNSMSDLFHERLTGLPSDEAKTAERMEADLERFARREGEPKRPDYIAQVFAVMSIAEQHTFQVLTKRPKAMCWLLSQGIFWLQVNAHRMARGYPVLPGRMSDYARGERTLANVWLGTSIENRRHVHRADLLRKTPAAVRFISAEPLLGPLVPDDYDGLWQDDYDGGGLVLKDIDWLIVGGESGPKARRMDPQWVRDLRDCCLPSCGRCERTEAACECETPELSGGHTAFFFKQWGGRTPRSGGRELDGRTWDEMPERQPVAA